MRAFTLLVCAGLLTTGCPGSSPPPDPRVLRCRSGASTAPTAHLTRCVDALLPVCAADVRAAEAREPCGSNFFSIARACGPGFCARGDAGVAWCAGARGSASDLFAPEHEVLRAMLKAELGPAASAGTTALHEAFGRCQRDTKRSDEAQRADQDRRTRLRVTLRLDDAGTPVTTVIDREGLVLEQRTAGLKPDECAGAISRLLDGGRFLPEDRVTLMTDRRASGRDVDCLFRGLREAGVADSGLAFSILHDRE